MNGWMNGWILRFRFPMDEIPFDVVLRRSSIIVCLMCRRHRLETQFLNFTRVRTHAMPQQLQRKWCWGYKYRSIIFIDSRLSFLLILLHSSTESRKFRLKGFIVEEAPPPIHDLFLSHHRMMLIRKRWRRRFVVTPSWWRIPSSILCLSCFKSSRPNFFLKFGNGGPVTRNTQNIISLGHFLIVLQSYRDGKKIA